MTTHLVRLFGAAIFGALAFGGAAQTTSGNSAPPAPSSSDSPQLTTNASTQARTEYEASRSYCFQLPQNKRDTCLSAAEDAYLRAIRGENPGEQGSPVSNGGARGTPRS